MNPNAHIVEGGGWITRQTVGKSRTRFFGFLTIIWFLISICTSFPFWDGWPQSFTGLDWLCTLLIVPQPVFIVPAIVFWFTEQPQAITKQHPNPDCNLRKLH
jgi:hypothetical protein